MEDGKWKKRRKVVRTGRRERVGKPKGEIGDGYVLPGTNSFNFCDFYLTRRDENGQTGKTGALTTPSDNDPNSGNG